MNLFQKIATRKPKLNKFDLSHERKFSMNMGPLYPIFVQDILPGDKFNVKTEIMLRMAPMLAPIMHRVNVFTHYFFVPNRLVWSEWEDFITGGREGTSNPVAPFFYMNQDNIDDGYFTKASLCDYFGLPTFPITAGTPTPDPVKVSAIPFRAYQMIYNEYYRDQNLEAELSLPSGSGEVTGANLAQLMTLRQRAWEKDYFTSALPWAQRGPEVVMPIDGTGTVTYKKPSQVFKNNDTFADPGSLGVNATGDLLSDFAGTADQSYIDNIDEVIVNNAESSINDLRRAVRLQEWLEKNARGGARYIEQILSHFGIVSSDARLQRPEYLGGGKTPVRISEVLQTMQESSGDGNPLGTMGGHGVSMGNTNGFGRRFEEHGYVIGIMSVLPRTAYQQGTPRHLTKFDKLDYAWPEFANIGEQELFYKEIYTDPYGSSGTADSTFGYQSRYAEYKYAPSTVHGDFRDNLAFWHMGRIFDSPPDLNENFVKADPTRRIFAVEDPDEQVLWCQLYNSVNCLRPLPYYGTPTL